MTIEVHSGADTRRMLLETAAKEIHEKGFRSCSVDDILATTGVTKGALYHHFKSKQELGLAVVDEIYREATLAPWREGLSRTANPVDDLLAMLQDKRVSSCSASVRCGCPLNNLAQEMASVDEDFRLHIENIFQEWRDTIVRALERGKINGTVRASVDSRKAAIFVTSLIEGAVGSAKNARDPSIVTSAVETLEVFVQTMRPNVSLRGRS